MILAAGIFSISLLAGAVAAHAEEVFCSTVMPSCDPITGAVTSTLHADGPCYVQDRLACKLQQAGQVIVSSADSRPRRAARLQKQVKTCIESSRRKTAHQLRCVAAAIRAFRQ